MSSAAQISANIANAQSSSGPRSETGKATSSKNAVVYGLFSGDFIRPGEETAYAVINAALLKDLTPVGVLEEVIVQEIRRATWRLRRCAEVEAQMIVGLDEGGYIFDPLEIAGTTAEKVQRSVDRSRSQAHRLLHKSTAELRKLQTERQYRNETFDSDSEADLASQGLADRQSIDRSLAKNLNRKPATSPIAKQTQSEQDGTPRNAPCPCNSGLKYKRCCGKGAPAVLHAV